MIASSFGGLLAVGPGFLDAGFQAFDATGDDAQIGEQHFVAKRRELGRRVAPANPFKTISRASPSRIKARRWGLSACDPAKSPGVSRNSTVAGVTFLGLWRVGQVVQTRIRERGDSHLARMDLAGIGSCSRQELKQRALATTREPDDSDTHPCIFSLLVSSSSTRCGRDPAEAPFSPPA